ncbi:MAG: HAD-IIIA family hydrolase [Candidatus Omnitrophota bacterium]
MNNKAEKIKALIVDVDGILTSGSIVYGNFTDDYRAFHVHDGMGFVLWHKAGLKSAIITSKSSRAVSRRVKELKIGIIAKNVKNKLVIFNKMLKKMKLNADEVCYIGDDLLDMAVLQSVGFSATVPQACDDVKGCVDYITNKSAGKGAVREVIELILKYQGKWESLVKQYSL